MECNSTIPALQSADSQREIFVCGAATLLLPFSERPKANPKQPFDKALFESAEDRKIQHQMLCRLLAEEKASTQGAKLVLALFFPEAASFYRLSEHLASRILLLNPKRFFYAVFSQAHTDLRVCEKMNEALFEMHWCLPESIGADLVKFCYSGVEEIADSGPQLSLELVNLLIESDGAAFVHRHLIRLYKNRSLVEALGICRASDILDEPLKGLDFDSEEIIERLCLVTEFSWEELDGYADFLEAPIGPQQCRKFCCLGYPVELFAGFNSIEDMAKCVGYFLSSEAFDMLFAFLEFFSTPRGTLQTEYGKLMGRKKEFFLDEKNLSTRAQCILAIGYIAMGDYEYISRFDLAFEGGSELEQRCLTASRYLSRGNEKRLRSSFQLFRAIYEICHRYLTVSETLPIEVFPPEMSLLELMAICKTLKSTNEEAFHFSSLAFVIEASLQSGERIRWTKYRDLQKTRLPRATVWFVFSKMGYLGGEFEEKTYVPRRGTPLDVTQALRSKCPICLDVVFEDCVCPETKNFQNPHMFHPRCIRAWARESSTCPICQCKWNL